MFFNGDKDPTVMTAKEIALEVIKTAEDTDLHEMSGTSELSKIPREQVEQMRNLINEVASEATAYKGLTKETLVGFKAGIGYGMAMMIKMTAAMSDKRIDDKETKRLLKMFMVPMRAIDAAVESFNDDAWLENLLKNAKVEPEPIKKGEKDKK